MQNLRVITPDASYARPISDLILLLRDDFAPGDDAEIRQFIALSSPAAIAEKLNDARYWYRVALLDDAFAGVIRLRDQSHLQHLFIEPRFQRLGLGRKLCELGFDYLRELGTPSVTVNSSLRAIGFYEKLGFHREGEPICKGLFCSQPMRLALPPRN
ncbi:MAG: GNAT family N-acetyltransferase [Pseudomonadales bacterium]|jgi:ribosomal protein S18 acetylase RimI-like enzyme|nr:GNAT family N-acetyltransferase [Pseudomonadales bacterium]